MNASDDRSAPADDRTLHRPAPVRTRNETRAEARRLEADARLHWNAILRQAEARWSRVPTEDLMRVEGNIHRLSGLVQLCYRLTRADADLQVQEFFDRNRPPR